MFVFLAIWIFQYTTATAMARLETQLEAAAVGGAMTLNAADFRGADHHGPGRAGSDEPDGLGYPDSPLYASIAQDLLDLYTTITDANPYTYFQDPADGRLYFAVSAGYLLDPQIGVTYRVPVDQIVGPGDVRPHGAGPHHDDERARLHRRLRQLDLDLQPDPGRGRAERRRDRRRLSR